MALKNYKSFPLLEDYLNYLSVIKGRSPNTVIEYRTDLLMFFSFLKAQKGISGERYDLLFVDKKFISEISLNDMYNFISNNQAEKQTSAGTRARKIVSIRQVFSFYSLSVSTAWLTAYLDIIRISPFSPESVYIRMPLKDKVSI